MSNTISKTTITILAASTIVPLSYSALPKLSKLFYLNYSVFLPINMFTGIFITNFDLRMLINCFVRFQLLSNISEFANQREIQFFTVLFSVPLLISNLFENLVTFESSINTAYICLLCFYQNEINFYGFIFSNKTLPFVYFLLEFILSGGQSKAYYGLAYGLIYISMKKEGIDVRKHIQLFYRKIKMSFFGRKLLLKNGRKLNFKPAMTK